MTPEETTAALHVFFGHCAEIVRGMVLRSEFGECRAMAQIDEEMRERGAALRFEVTVGAAGPIHAELWLVSSADGAKLAHVPAPAGGAPFRLAG